jgi:hypothetical protein
VRDIYIVKAFVGTMRQDMPTLLRQRQPGELEFEVLTLAMKVALGGRVMQTPLRVLYW